MYMYNDLMSTETLTTFIGLVAATFLIVQFTKSIIKRQLVMAMSEFTPLLLH